jgi:hypothetical protein
MQFLVLIIIAIMILLRRFTEYHSCEVPTINDSSYRLNFDPGKKNKIHHHSQKEHVKISKIAKFGCEIL